MQNYHNSIQDKAGNAIYNALVTVTTIAGNPVTLFSDNYGTVLPQVRTDENGMFNFYVSNGRYNLTVSGDRIYTFVLYDVLIEDDEISAIVVDTFDTVPNIAALRALIGTTNNTTVSTLGYWAVGDGGHGTYRFDLADTTSADDGGSIIVANDGGRWKLVYNGEVDVAQFGACTGTDDLVYINKALAFGDTVSGGNVLPPNKIEEFTITAKQVLWTSNTITHPGGQSLNLNWIGGIQCAATWAGATTDPILMISGNNSEHFFGHIDCKNLCSGVRFSGYNINITCQGIYHFVDFGFNQLQGSGGDSEINVSMSQWSKTDPEFANQANFTAKGIWLQGADALYKGCISCWSLYPVYISSTAVSNRFENCHFYQGTGGAAVPVPVDPIVIYNDCAQANYMYNCYFDNGYIWMKRAGLAIRGGQFAENALTNITEPWIRYFNVTAGSSPAGAEVRGLRASVGFYPGVGTYPGDYTAINAITSDVIAGNHTDTFKQKVVVCPVSGTAPLIKYLKPVDNMIFTYQVGAGDLQVVSFSETEEIHETNLFRIQSINGLVPHTLQLGTGSTGISEESGGQLSLNNGGGQRWTVASGGPGHFVPADDQLTDIGTNTSRVRNFTGRNVRLSPTTSETITQNEQIAFERVDDTNIKIKYRGTDGVTRSATITVS